MKKKKFFMPYDDVLSLGYVFHSMFVEQKSEFTAFWNSFADPFADDFLAELKAADNLPVYVDDLSHQVYLSEKLKEKLLEATEFYRRFLQYVKLAWGSSSAELEVFSRVEFNRKRNQPLMMISILGYSYKTAEKPEYKPFLVDAGFSEADITRLQSLSTELGEAFSERNRFRNASGTRSQERIDAFNKFWDRMVLISKMAKLIFADSPGTVKTFQLYSKGKKKKGFD